MKKIILIMLLSLVSSSVMALNNWGYMACDGFDGSGQYIYLTADSDTDLVNINGDILRIVGKTANGRGVVTEDFISTLGMVVYDSLVPVAQYALNLYQFNSVTNDLLAQAQLSCDFYGNNTFKANVANQKLFSPIKASIHAPIDLANVSGFKRQHSKL